MEGDGSSRGANGEEPGTSTSTLVDEKKASGSKEDGTSILITGGTHHNAHFGPKIVNETHIHLPRDGDPEQQKDDSSSKTPEGCCKLTDNIFVNTRDKCISKKHGVVYRGVQTFGDVCQPRDIAVKMIPHSRRKEKEAKNLLALTTHGNVVQIIHADTVPSQIEKRLYIAMELCSGKTLEGYIEDRRLKKIPFSTTQALEFSRQVIDGLNHIHSKEIVHRDLKPSSVLFSLDGKCLKIIDFGLSKDLTAGLTVNSVSTKIGIDGFRAPEMYSSSKKSRSKKASDVFSLGILLYYIWSYGRHPFGDDGTLWAHYIRTRQNFGIDKLLIPDKEKAKDLLMKMMENDYKKRCTVEDVKNDTYICQAIGTILTSVMDQVWSGAVKVGGSDDTSPFACELYERYEQNVLDLKDKDARLHMLYVPRPTMKDVFDGIDAVPPNGYLAVSKDVYQKRMQAMLTRKMGWINAFRDDERIGTFVVFQPKDYEEVVAIFLKNPDEFLSRLRSLASTNPKTTDSASDTPDVEMINVGQPEDDGAAQAPRPLQTATEGDGSGGDLLRAPIEDPGIIPPSGEDTPETEEDLKVEQPEYISWWVYGGSQAQSSE